MIACWFTLLFYFSTLGSIRFIRFVADSCVLGLASPHIAAGTLLAPMVHAAATVFLMKPDKP